VRSAHPEVEIYVYDNAGHGFNCDARVSFYPPAAELARGRTLTFLKTHIA
jgi:carboxymethylenebutenolidase